MAKRMILMLATTVVFLGVIGFVKFRQIQGAIAQAAAFQPPPEAVTTIVAQQEQWPSTFRAIGTVVAVHGVTVSADLPGIVEKIAFDSGRQTGADDVLVYLDTKQEQAQLAAAEAQRELANLSFERMRGLRAKGVTSQAELDRAAAEAKQAEARVSEIRAVIERKTIRAPFAGLLGIRQVDLGQYLSGGDPVVPLQTLHPIYVNFAVPQQEVGALAVGAGVRLEIEARPGAELTGRVSAINSIVDENTRNVQVQATFENEDGTLRPGMFVEAVVVMGEATAVVALPASSIQYAPYGNTVFLVEDLKGQDGRSYLGVRQEFVKLGGARGDQVAVLSGVDPGDQVVTSGVFKLRNGAAVQVNNEIQPANDPAPLPEDS
jgi:membrane fusion protein (multidrug efflux system)